MHACDRDNRQLAKEATTSPPPFRTFRETRARMALELELELQLEMFKQERCSYINDDHVILIWTHHILPSSCFYMYISEAWYAFLSDFVQCKRCCDRSERAWQHAHIHTHTHTQSIRRHYINHLCASTWMQYHLIFIEIIRVRYDRPLSNLFLYFDIKMRRRRRKNCRNKHIFQYSICFS